MNETEINNDWLAEVLSVLPATGREVAQHFANWDIVGAVAAPAGCPLAVWLLRQLSNENPDTEYRINVNTAYAEVYEADSYTPIAHVLLPAGASEFVFLFDLFGELIRR